MLDGTKTMPARGVVVTFDDGLREQYELAWPILRAKGIPAIMFVNTKPVDEDFVTTTHKIHILRSRIATTDLLKSLRVVLDERGIGLELPPAQLARAAYQYDGAEDAQLKYFLNHSLGVLDREAVVNSCFGEIGFDEAAVSRTLYMTSDIVADLGRADSLGTHGHAHLPLGLLDLDSAKRDVASSLRLLNEWTGRETQALSFPFGFMEACSRSVASFARASLVRFAFTMERAGNERLDQPMFMARFSNNDVPGGSSCPRPDEFWASLRHATWFRQNGMGAR